MIDDKLTPSAGAALHILVTQAGSQIHETRSLTGRASSSYEIGTGLIGGTFTYHAPLNARTFAFLRLRGLIEESPETRTRYRPSYRRYGLTEKGRKQAAKDSD